MRTARRTKVHHSLRRLLAGSCLLTLGAAVACGTLSSGEPVEPLPAVTEAGAPSDAPSAVVDAEAGDADADADAGPEPLSVLSPYRDGGLTYPESITWTLSALGDAVIRYTTDGTDPVPTSRSGTGTVTLADLVDGTVIKWTVGSSTKVHQFLVHVDGADGGSATNGGVILQNFRFSATTTAITTVKQDAGSVDVHADIRLWNQQSCPACIDFLTVGIDKPSDCFATAVPGTYPGASALNHVFSVQVPAEAGVYAIRSGFSQVFDCDAALGESLSDTQIGVLVVTP